MAEDENIIPGPAFAEYFLLKCPKLGKYRSTILCTSVCCDTNNATKLVREIRKDCDVWAEYQKKLKDGVLPTVPTFEYEV